MTSYIGPFEQLDAPSVQTLDQPPPLPTFTDGRLVRQADLNALTVNLQYLQQYVLGGSQGGAAAKPMTILTAVTPNTFTSGAATLLTWDTVIVDNVSAWDGPTLGDPQTVTVQREGFYRINFQCGTTLAYPWNTVVSMFILVNGSDIANNSVNSCTWYGNQGSIEVTVPLAETASIQVAYQQNSGSSCFHSTQFGGARLEVEWVAPTIPVSQTTT